MTLDYNKRLDRELVRANRTLNDFYAAMEDVDVPDGRSLLRQLKRSLTRIQYLRDAVWATSELLQAEIDAMKSATDDIMDTIHTADPYVSSVTVDGISHRSLSEVVGHWRSQVYTIDSYLQSVMKDSADLHANV